jgi:hypothetical protein
MTRSAKLGIASVLLLGSVFVPPFPTWREPISFACVWGVAILGLLAAQQGNKWWFVVPVVIVAGFVLSLYLTAHSF